MGEEGLGREVALTHGQGEGVDGVRVWLARGLMPSPHKDVAHALFEFAYIPWPRIVGSEVAGHALEDLVGQLLCLVRADHALTDKTDQMTQLFRRLPQLLSQRGGHDEVRTEPAVQIFAEPSGSGLVAQVAVGGRD